MKILSLAIGFVDIPGVTTLNIFTAGCTLKCPHCHNQELWDFNHPRAQALNLACLHERINASLPLPKAICWMGGEPLDNPELLPTMQELKKSFSLPQVLFSGRTREEILEGFPEAFRIADIVKTGRWNNIPFGNVGCSQHFWQGDVEIPYRELASVLCSLPKEERLSEQGEQSPGRN
jgi:hypothetical protein